MPREPATVAAALAEKLPNPETLSDALQGTAALPEEDPKCSVCGKVFTKHYALVRHEREQHRAVEETRHLFCQYTDCKKHLRGFKRHSHLQEHINRHHGGIADPAEQEQDPVDPELRGPAGGAELGAVTALTGESSRAVAVGGRTGWRTPGRKRKRASVYGDPSSDGGRRYSGLGPDELVRQLVERDERLLELENRNEELEARLMSAATRAAELTAFLTAREDDGPAIEESYTPRRKGRRRQKQSIGEQGANAEGPRPEL